ncbi:hypothetical protein JK359_33400 [Streptomyces actinomycinicus]|uniref:Uncharacterized protein n=1 Tax=Streptomyces actinomycinicus TaxID=1695166 RepID=A0A937JTI4_9ACTN|nr:hypothetical protein [Streptomyces actinomycinicus]MBL1086803.1 hypothetical protein [Streptomyces actinomycinicus]
MPAHSTATLAAPRTFWSEAALAAAVDAVFAEALVEELAAAFRDEPSAEPAITDDAHQAPVIVLPDTDTLIRQAGIATGPCPPDPRIPTRSGQLARTAGRCAARAAWVLLKYSTLFAAGVLVCSIRLLWDLTFPRAGTTRQLETAPDPRPEAVRALRAADFLQATSETIRVRGWMQGDFVTPDGVCVIGAERELVHSGYASRKTATDANVYLRSVIGRRSIPRWNDNLQRTEEQVHRALLAAAERARTAAQ